MKQFILFLILFLGVNVQALDSNFIEMDLKYGKVFIELYPDKAPKTVARIKELVNQKFYDGIVFHRVIEGFMVQTGDPTGTGYGGSGQKIVAEFNDMNHSRGVLSMARSQDVNSADSQFFIVLKDSSFLNNQYTAFGRVTKGMEVVDQIKKGDQNNNGLVTDPDNIISMKLIESLPQ